ncbi:hypothetical protein IL306_011861 [Fusarium sp. DS 682]|nr:hypothetical protein IL306_011861 [Fusarium sp. DS 682]
MDSVDNSGPLYMDNTLQNDNQRYLNGVDTNYEGNKSGELLGNLDEFDFRQFDNLPLDAVLENDLSSIDQIDTALTQSHDLGTQLNQNPLSHETSNNWDNPTVRSSHQLQEAIQMPRTSLEQQPQPGYQPNHWEASIPKPNMSLGCTAVSNSNTQHVDPTENAPLALYSPHGQADLYVPSANGRPHLIRDSFIQPQPEYNSYQPHCNYPELGIEGNQIPLGIAQYPPQAQNGAFYQPMHKTIQVAKCGGCFLDPHPGECFPQAVPQHPRAPPRASHRGRQQVPYQAPYRQPIGLLAAPKRSAKFYEDSDEEKPLKRPRKIARSLKIKRGKKSKVTASEVYKFPIYDLNWRSSQGFEYHYLENEDGQWDPKFRLSAEGLKDYIKNCPRDLRIWLQHYPAQSKHRTVEADNKCRYEDCPVKGNTIRHGWFRVAFDEFHEATSNGEKDPFKMAGTMHLWCFERCIDPAGLLRVGKMQPDTRELDWEECNPMAIIRDSDANIVERTIIPWVRKRQGRVMQVPFVKHEDSLSFALCSHHKDNETGARQRTRDIRNAKKPEMFKKTIEFHMGRLDWWVDRENAFREWKKTHKGQEDAAPELGELPASSTPNGLLPTRKSLQLTPNGSTKNFNEMLSSVSVENDWALEYDGYQLPVKGERASLSAIPSPSQLLFEPQNDVHTTPDGETHRQDQVVATPRQSGRLSAGNIPQSVQTEVKVVTPPAKVQSSGLALPTTSTKVTEEQCPAVTSPQQNGRIPSLTVSDKADLWGESPPSRASSRAGERAQGSPLRRSSRRVSTKKSP